MCPARLGPQRAAKRGARGVAPCPRSAAPGTHAILKSAAWAPSPGARSDPHAARPGAARARVGRPGARLQHPLPQRAVPYVVLQEQAVHLAVHVLDRDLEAIERARLGHLHVCAAHPQARQRWPPAPAKTSGRRLCTRSAALEDHQRRCGNRTEAQRRVRGNRSDAQQRGRGNRKAGGQAAPVRQQDRGQATGQRPRDMGAATRKQAAGWAARRP